MLYICTLEWASLFLSFLPVMRNYIVSNNGKREGGKNEKELREGQLKLVAYYAKHNFFYLGAYKRRSLLATIFIFTVQLTVSVYEAIVSQ